MNDWRLTLKVLLGSTLLVVAVIFGLTKMAGNGTTLTIDQITLLDGAMLVKENGETKVSVVNFTDMQCPACKRADQLMSSLASMDGVKLVLRHFPLSMHKNAAISARAVEAARQMGKGWEMVDLLFGKQEEWSAEKDMEARLVGFARELGLDETMFKEKLNSSETSTTVQTDINLGDQLRLSGTPTVFVNGEQISPDFVVAKVEELLKKN